MRFIVVDDNPEEIKHIKLLLNNILNYDYDILCFSHINYDLKLEIKNKDIRKIYILNVDNGEQTSGITLAKMIREDDFDSEIIFITKHDKMFEIAHRSVYKVFDFIEKFHEFDKRFKKDIRDIVKNEYDDKMFRYKDLCIYYKSIIYIYRETEERKLIIVTDKQRYRVNLSIKQICNLLDKRFVQCHRSCIFNVFEVENKNYKDGYFITSGGEKVYLLSKMFKKNIDKVTDNFFK